MKGLSDRIKNVVAKLLEKNPRELNDGDSLRGALGADSAEIVEILCAIEKEFGVSLAQGAEGMVSTVGDLQRLVSDRLRP